MTDELDFDRVKQLLANEATTEKAKELILMQKPQSRAGQVEQLLNETEDAIKILSAHLHVPFISSENLQLLLDKTEKGLILTASELEKVADYLRVLNLLQRFFAKNQKIAPLLANYATEIVVMPELENAIYAAIEHEQVADRADRDLGKMRREVKKKQAEIRTDLNRILTSKKYAKALQDSLLLEKEGHLTVPIKASFKSQLPGQIYGESSGKKTVYWQPVKVVNLTSEVDSLKSQIENLELAILGNLTAQVYEKIAILKQNLEIVTAFDVIFARGKYSLAINGKRPQINRENLLELNGVKHPLITKPVPLTIKLDQTNSVLMITGPNAGGKTVALKTAGLMTLMTEIGLFLPSKKPCQIPLMDNVFTLIGDHQSIDNSLSTFSAEMSQIAQISQKAQVHSLILLDELGTGTDPNEGSAIAIATLQELYLKGCLIVATTHYSAIKDFAVKHDGFLTAEMDFDLEKLTPTYHLKLNSVGDSRALWIAKRVGMSAEILKSAQKILDQGSYPLKTKTGKIHKKAKPVGRQALQLHKGDIVYLTSLKKREFSMKRFPIQIRLKSLLIRTL